jgi:hypothetical protein
MPMELIWNKNIVCFDFKKISPKLFGPHCVYMYENPDRASLFCAVSTLDVDRNTARITGNFSSQNSMGAKRGWRCIVVDHILFEMYQLHVFS